jgi:hypothetical protein
MSEHDEQAEHEREVGRAVIEAARRQDAAALAAWERNRRSNMITTAIAVVGIGIMAFITPVPLARWSTLVIAGCLVVRYLVIARQPNQG